MAVACDGSRLRCRGVVESVGLFFFVVGEGGLMVEQIDILQILCDVGFVDGVGAISERTWWIGRCGESCVGYYSAVGACIVHSAFDIVDLADGYLVGVDHVA